MKAMRRTNFILRRLSASAKARAAVAAKQTAYDIPISKDVEVFADIPFFSQDGTPLAADIYRPSIGDALLPVAVVVHGGGLFSGDHKLDRVFCQILAGKGYLVYALDYRLIDEADAFGEISDVCAGFSFVHKTLMQYGGDPRRVCVVAESAGAFLSVYATAMTNSSELASLIGCAPAELPIQALVCFSGMFYTAKLDLIGAVYRSALYGPRRRDKEFMKHMDPEHSDVISNLPPVLLTSSTGDFLRQYTLRYAKALCKAGHVCELLYYRGDRSLIHAFPSLEPMLPRSAEVLKEMLIWLDGLDPA